MGERMNAKEIKRTIEESLEDFRQEELEEAYRLIELDRNKSIQEVVDDIKDMLEVTKTQLIDRLELLYSKYKIDGLTYLELMGKPLTRSAQKSFKRDLEDYIARLDLENIQMDTDFRERLENGEKEATIIDYFLLPAIAEFEIIFNEIQARLVEFFRNTTTENINREAFEIFTAIGIGMALDDESIKVDDILERTWRPTGSSWDEVLWYNKRIMLNDLSKAVIANAPLEQGKDFSKEAIQKFVNKTTFASKRLATSDSTFYATEGHKDLMDYLEIDSSEYVAVLDAVTTEICRSLDGSIIPNSEIRIGENAPPMHENCRSVLVPYIDESIADDFATRAARDKKTGKTYFVAGDMTYREWEKTPQSLDK